MGGHMVAPGTLPAQAGQRLRDVGSAAHQGLAMGGGDELNALAATAGQYLGNKWGGAPGKSYEENLAREREEYEEIPERIRLGGEIAGSLPTGGAIAKTMAGVAPQTAAKLPGWLKAMGLGGLMGGTWGGLSSEGDLGERLEAGAWGAGAGAATGGGLYGAGKGIGYSVDRVGSALKTRYAPKAQSVAKVGQALKRDRMTKPRAEQKLAELGPEGMLADLGPNTQNYAGAVYRHGGPAGQRAKRILEARGAGEQGRIAQAIQKGLDPQDYYAAEEAFLGNLRTRAAPLYKQAYEANPALTSNRLTSILGNKNGKAAANKALQMVRNEADAGDEAAIAYLATFGDELDNPQGPLSLQTWDQIKRGIDALMDAKVNKNELTGKVSQQGRSVDKLRRGLLEELDRLTGGKTGDYAKARAIYSGDAEVLEALRNGRKAMKLDPEQISRQMNTLSESGKQAYRSGLARELKDVVAKTPDDAGKARRIFGNDYKRQQVKAVFSDEGDYNTLKQVLESEIEMTKTSQGIMRGSQTAQRLRAEEDALTKAGEIGGVVAGSHVPGGVHPLMIARLARQAGRAIMGGSPELTDLKAAKMLFNRNPKANQAALDRIFTPSVWSALPPEARQQLGKAVIMIAGQQEGKLVGENTRGDQ